MLINLNRTPVIERVKKGLCFKCGKDDAQEHTALMTNEKLRILTEVKCIKYHSECIKDIVQEWKILQAQGLVNNL